MTTRKAITTALHNPVVRMVVTLGISVACVLGAIAVLLFSAPTNPWGLVLILGALVFMVISSLYCYKLTVIELN